MKITVIGTGHVGLVVGLCFAEVGHDVICLDNDPHKIDLLNQGRTPFYEPYMDDLLVRARACGRIRFYAELAPHGFFYPVSPGENSASLGGNVATNAGGMRAVKYGVTRHHVLGLEAVLPGGRLVTVHQVHSADTIEAGDWPDDKRPPADALVTDQPGLLLGILTADCAPVLLADRKAGVAGAAHAGWRGAVGGVCESVVGAMERLGARRERIAAAIGPAIAARSYEVDQAFADRHLR